MKGRYINTQVILACLSKKHNTSKDIHSQLEETIAELVLGSKVLSSESILVTSACHQDALRRAAGHLRAAISSRERALPLDFVSIDLRAAYDDLGEVTGETASDDLLDRIFSEFCIGK